MAKIFISSSFYRQIPPMVFFNVSKIYEVVMILQDLEGHAYSYG